MISLFWNTIKNDSWSGGGLLVSDQQRQVISGQAKKNVGQATNNGKGQRPSKAKRLTRLLRCTRNVGQIRASLRGGTTTWRLINGFLLFLNSLKEQFIFIVNNFKIDNIHSYFSVKKS